MNLQVEMANLINARQKEMIEEKADATKIFYEVSRVLLLHYCSYVGAGLARSGHMREGAEKAVDELLVIVRNGLLASFENMKMMIEVERDEHEGKR